MRTFALVFLAVSLAVAVGCHPKARQPGPGIASEAAKGGLVIEMRVPRRNLVCGETVPVTVIARNCTEKEMVIRTDSGALVYVTLWRRTAVGDEQVKRYPESTTSLAGRWRLAPESVQSFPLNLVVAPDWPTRELLKITAELNGRPEIKASGYIQVFATQRECDEAEAH